MTNRIDLAQLKQDAEAISNPRHFMAYVTAETVLALVSVVELASEVCAEIMGGDVANSIHALDEALAHFGADAYAEPSTEHTDSA